MLDRKWLRANLEEAAERLAARDFELDVAALRRLFDRRAELLLDVEQLRAESKLKARVVPGGGGVDEQRREAQRASRERLRQLERTLAEVDAELEAVLVSIPNVPLPDVPPGGEEAAIELSRHGHLPSFSFEAASHVELGEALGILDIPAAAQMSGTRFALLRGMGARLNRALANLMLDYHTRAGFVEVVPPHLVSREAMVNTGQLPKFEDELFHVSGIERELLLIPTGEVPLVNMYAGEVFDAASLPARVAALTACYRAEAGSHGRDTRGLIRVHQFDKIELVVICHAAEAEAELEQLVTHVEGLLALLELPFRRLLLGAADMAVAVEKTIDLEVWMPGQARYREVSSCSSCGQFQARRAGIVRRDGQRREPVATLNGSGLPLGRILAALLENNQNADGSVSIPRALRPYLDELDAISTP